MKVRTCFNSLTQGMYQITTKSIQYCPNDDIKITGGVEHEQAQYFINNKEIFYSGVIFHFQISQWPTFITNGR